VYNPRLGAGVSHRVLVAAACHNIGRNGCQNVLFLLNACVNFFAIDPDVWGGLNADFNAAWANAYDREFDAIANDDRFAWSTC
jgi:hypothetical protein